MWARKILFVILPSMNTGRALYPGSFDPLTHGHLDLIRRGTALFGHLTVGIAVNPSKTPWFTPEERVRMLQEQFAGDPRIEVISFRGLVVDFCMKNRFSVILRGLRTISDFEFEYQMALTNRALAPTVETVFVMPSEQFSFTSSRMIKEILDGGGDVSRFIPAAVERAMRAKLSRESSS